MTAYWLLSGDVLIFGLGNTRSSIDSCYMVRDDILLECTARGLHENTRERYPGGAIEITQGNRLSCLVPCVCPLDVLIDTALQMRDDSKTAPRNGNSGFFQPATRGEHQQ